MNEKQGFQADGIMKQGYGFIPKMIMKDKDITIEAKAIYAYLSSYTGAGNTAYPSISLMCGDLSISEGRFYKHRKLLVEKGYIVIEKKQNEGGWSNNVYRLPFKPYPQNLSTQNLSTQNLSTQNLSTQNKGTKSNSLKSNSLKNNKTTKDSSGGNFREIIQIFENNGFGMINSNTKDRLVDLSSTYTEDWLIDALLVAVDSNVRKISYVEGILKTWKAEGKDAGKPKEKNQWEYLEEF